MNEKPEALRLAEWHENVRLVGVQEECWKAAAELRRQHEEIERLREALTEAKDLALTFGADRLLDRINAALRREEA